MADKRISQLVERTDIANNDVLPIVASGATTTNKVTISTIQDWMQDNLDVGVTSVGLTLGTTGTDVNVTGSPITTSGNITINIPDASASNRGVVTTGSQVFGGVKTFANGFILPSAGGSNQATRFLNIGTIHEGSAGSNQIGFNNSNNIYFGKGLSNGGVIQWTNAAVRYYTLPDADGTIALASQLDGYVTLGTAQTITGQKTFSTSGSSDTAIINHGSGSGIALNITKAGNGEGLRVTKTSGSGNAVTITGGTLSAEAGQFSGDVQTATRFAASSGSNGITITPNVGGTQNRIETTGSLPLSLVSAAAITMAAGGTTPQITLATTGAVTLTGALNGTSANFSGNVGINTATPDIIGYATKTFGILGVGSDFPNMQIGIPGTSGSTTDIMGDINFFSRNGTGAVVSRSLIRSGLDGATTNNYFSFFTMNAGTLAERLKIASNGAATFSVNTNASLLITNSGQTPILSFRSNGVTAAGRIRVDEAFGGGEMVFSTKTTGGVDTDRMYIAPSGSVGIGTASPPSDTRLTARATSSTGYNLFIEQDNGLDGFVLASTSAHGALTFSRRDTSGANTTERMRITAGGEVLVGTTIIDPRNFTTGNYGVKIDKTICEYAVEVCAFNLTASSNGKIIDFRRNGGQVGSIDVTTTSTSYVTSSDYRLKEDLKDIKGLEKVQAIKVYNYKWKSEDSRMDGVLAHELAEVLPYAVNGEKDQVDEEGNDVMQGVDYSKIVPILIKAIQELKTEIDSLKNQIK
jgi:hypothetical protein